MNVFQMDYYKTYYFADICDSVMENTFDYVTTLNGFWGDGRKDYRNSKVKSHLVFCKKVENTEIEVVRILHEKMDIKNRINE